MTNVPMTRPELMLAQFRTHFFHNSSYVRLDEGRIVHACCDWVNHSEDGGLSWSEPKVHRDANGNRIGGAETSLVKLSGRNEIGMSGRLKVELTGTEYALPPNSVGFLFWRSMDGGETWDPPVPMSPPGLPTAGYQDTFVRTGSGRIVLPVFLTIGQSSGPNDRFEPMSGKPVQNQFVGTAGHFFDPRFSCSYVLYSDDDGHTWQMNKDGALIILHDWNALFSYSNEATLTEVKPGRLLMMMRNGLGRLFQAWSNDNGESWTRPQPTVLASSTCPAQVRTLPNGHLLCVWNQEDEQEIRAGYNRTRISSAISRDGGRVWEFFQNVESLHETTRVEPGPIQPTRPEEIYLPAGQPATERDPRFVQVAEEHGRWSYPSVFVGDDRVMIAHTYTTYVHDPTKAEFFISSKRPTPGDPRFEPLEPNGSMNGFNQKLKVLPLKWFYGGKEPADNPFLKAAYEPAKP